MKKLFMKSDDSVVGRGTSVMTPNGLAVVQFTFEPKREGHVGLVTVLVGNCRYNYHPNQLGMEWRTV